MKLNDYPGVIEIEMTDDEKRLLSKFVSDTSIAQTIALANDIDIKKESRDPIRSLFQEIFTKLYPEYVGKKLHQKSLCVKKQYVKRNRF